MKKISSFISVILLLFLVSGCSEQSALAQIAATTLPVYEFTARLCDGTPITVTRLVTEEVSCLHDYALNVKQVQAAEAAELIVISGAGLEAFLDDILLDKQTVDASQGIELIVPEEHHHTHESEESDHEGHHHEQDPHIWLSPINAMMMAENICHGLQEKYPQFDTVFAANLDALLSDLSALNDYGEAELNALACRELITFHDGFSYLADACNLTVLEAVEEEAGSETSASKLVEIITLVRGHDLPAIFTETNGSTASASVISAETGVGCYTLDMAVSGSSYFELMYQNIDTLKEALE